MTTAGEQGSKWPRRCQFPPLENCIVARLHGRQRLAAAGHGICRRSAGQIGTKTCNAAVDSPPGRRRYRYMTR